MFDFHSYREVYTNCLKSLYNRRFVVLVRCKYLSEVMCLYKVCQAMRAVWVVLPVASWWLLEGNVVLKKTASHPRCATSLEIRDDAELLHLVGAWY